MNAFAKEKKMNTYHIKSTNAWGYDSYTFEAENDQKALDQAENFIERNCFPFFTNAFELTRVIQEPVASVTLAELRERKKKKVEDKRKKERWELYQKLKDEFEATV